MAGGAGHRRAAAARWQRALPLVWLAASTLSAQAPRLRAELPAGGLTFGQPFALELELPPPVAGAPPFDERQLQPLVVELLAQQPTAAGGERRRYRARCLRSGEVAVFDLRLQVRSSLPEPPGELEWPGSMRALPVAASRWWWLAGAGLVLVPVALRWRRPRPAPSTPPTPAPAADHAALLAALPLPGDGDPVPFHQQLKQLLRDHCEANLGVRAGAATSEELGRALQQPPALLQALVVADGVLFAARRPAAAEHAAARAAAVQFVQRTTTTAATAAGQGNA
jgi:hypothetical protein